ncbi:MAG: hypothetical protein WCL60_15795, partial [Methylococcales bacterium]
MNDAEIIDKASDVFLKFTAELNDGLYKELNGRLSIRWSDKRCFYACASVGSKVEEPPKHYIDLTQETAVLLYRDIEDYYHYIKYGADNEKFDIIFKDFDYPKALSSESAKEHRCKNMFISGLTWILFHELGHLIQEHGHIRTLYNCSESTEVVDCATNDNEISRELSVKAAAVSHVTEMAADFYAMISCLRALVRHFEGDELEAEIKSFTSALALVLYRFHGVNSYVATEVPEGSHPQPLIRLEQTMPLIHEVYSIFDLLETNGIRLNRLDLINITSWSSFTVGFFWLRKNRQLGVPDDYFLSGSL